MAPVEQHNAAAQRGTKRKRPSGKKPAVKKETQGEILSKKLHHGLHEVRKAAKKAAAFELRKLVKRLKQARAQDAKGKPVKGDDPAEMERQLEVLKHADPEQFANTALKTKILKDKLLAQNDDVQAALADKLSANLVAPQESGSSAAKVHGRLLSSKILAEAVHAVVDTLREVLDPSLAKDKAKAKKGAEEEADDDESADEEDVVGRPGKGKKARLAEESEREEHEEEDEEGSDLGVDDAGWESGTVDGGEDASWESGTVDGGDDGVIGSSDEDEDEDDENGEDESADESSDEPPKAKVKATAKDTKSKSKATSGESTFLPSLSVGFTRGDSDASDISDGEADAPRKNRRGQRARRAIWEKKYGRNANHVKEHQAEQDSRRQRRDGPRGGGGGGSGNAGGPGKPQWQARGSGGAPPRHGAQKLFVAPQRTDGGWAGRTAGASANPKTGGSKEEKALHPSWEAKRKLKEKMNPGIVLAQGKKIKFS
ncbi:Bud-site selection protein [Lentinus tigrinus ALCF2SS1-7]